MLPSVGQPKWAAVTGYHNFLPIYTNVSCVYMCVSVCARACACVCVCVCVCACVRVSLTPGEKPTGCRLIAQHKCLWSCSWSAGRRRKGEKVDRMRKRGSSQILHISCLDILSGFCSSSIKIHRVVFTCFHLKSFPLKKVPSENAYKEKPESFTATGT